MNKRRIIVAAIVIAAVVTMVIVVTACIAHQDNNHGHIADTQTVTPTDIITPSLTENSTTPEFTASAEPTATQEETPTNSPMPEGWYIDPKGYIPSEVEVLVNDGGNSRNFSWCITRRDEDLLLQGWSRDGLEYEFIVPEEMLLGHRIRVDMMAKGEIIATSLLEDGNPFRCIFYYNDCQENEFCFNVTSYLLNGAELYLATVDGYAIKYEWGKDYYWSYYYGGYVQIINEVVFVVDGNCEDGMPPFEKVYL